MRQEKNLGAVSNFSRGAAFEQIKNKRKIILKLGPISLQQPPPPPLPPRLFPPAIPNVSFLHNQCQKKRRGTVCEKHLSSTAAEPCSYTLYLTRRWNSIYKNPIMQQHHACAGDKGRVAR